MFSLHLAVALGSKKVTAALHDLDLKPETGERKTGSDQFSYGSSAYSRQNISGVGDARAKQVGCENLLKVQSQRGVTNSGDEPSISLEVSLRALLVQSIHEKPPSTSHN